MIWQSKRNQKNAMRKALLGSVAVAGISSVLILIAWKAGDFILKHWIGFVALFIVIYAISARVAYVEYNERDGI